MMHQVVMQLVSSHLKKNPRDDNEPGAFRLIIICYTWKKNKEMTTSQGGLPSFAKLEKKNKEMTTSQEGLQSSTTHEKKTNDDEPKRLVVICYIWEKKTNKWRQGSWFVIIFYTWKKNEQKWKRIKEKKVWCTFICHRCTSYLLEEHFLQHHFNNIFCNTALTLLL